MGWRGNRCDGSTAALAALAVALGAVAKGSE